MSKTLVAAAVALVLLIASLVVADKQATYFDAVQAADPSFIKLKNGALVKVLKKGTEAQSPLKDTHCDMHYEGRLPNYDSPLEFDGGKKFDSSFDRGQPIAFAPSQVVSCWSAYMQLMVPGDKVRIVCPWSLAYGAQGMPQAGIPGKSPLVFIMEMISVKGKGKKAEKAREMFEKESGKAWDSIEL